MKGMLGDAITFAAICAGAYTFLLVVTSLAVCMAPNLHGCNDPIKITRMEYVFPNMRLGCWLAEEVDGGSK